MSFSDDIKKFAEKTGNTINEVVVSVILDINEKVIKKTPVDTGWARGGWVASLGSPNRSAGIKDKSGQSAISKNAVVALSAPGKVYYLSNNVEYIGVLEYGGFPNPAKQGTGKTAGGFSLQSPRGMVRMTMMEVKKELSRQVRRKLGYVR